MTPPSDQSTQQQRGRRLALAGSSLVALSVILLLVNNNYSSNTINNEAPTANTASTFDVSSKTNSETMASGIRKRRQTEEDETMTATSQLPPCSSVITYATSKSFGPGDQVSLGNAIFQCKPYPESGFCNQFEPGGVYSSMGWLVAGGCCEVNCDDNDGGSTTVSPTEATATEGDDQVLQGCPPDYTTSSPYVGGSVVAFEGTIYQCIDGPSYQYCGQYSYRPAGPYSDVVWNVLGKCDGTYSPTTSPTEFVSVSPTFSPTASPTNLPSNNPTVSPSNLPSNSPTSSSPTFSPSKLPSSSPTKTQFWYPDFYYSLDVIRCVFGEGYDDYMALEESAHLYLFEREEDCCEEHACYTTSTSSTAAATEVTSTTTTSTVAATEAASTTTQFWYPDFSDATRCVYGEGYDDYMAFEENAHLYLFEREEDCCEEHACVTTSTSSTAAATEVTSTTTTTTSTSTTVAATEAASTTTTTSTAAATEAASATIGTRTPEMSCEGLKFHPDTVTFHMCTNSDSPESYEATWPSAFFFDTPQECCEFFSWDSEKCKIDDVCKPPSCSDLKFHPGNTPDSGCTNSEDYHEQWDEPYYQEHLFHDTALECCDMFWVNRDGPCPIVDVCAPTATPTTAPELSCEELKFHPATTDEGGCTNTQVHPEVWTTVDMKDHFFFDTAMECCEIFGDYDGSCAIVDICAPTGSPTTALSKSERSCEKLKFHPATTESGGCTNSQVYPEEWTTVDMKDYFFFDSATECCNMFIREDGLCPIVDVCVTTTGA